MPTKDVDTLSDKLDCLVQQISGVGSDVKKLQIDFYSHSDMAKEQWEINRNFREEMEPLMEGLRVLQYLNKALKWGGLTLASLVAGLYWLFHRQ